MPLRTAQSIILVIQEISRSFAHFDISFIPRDSNCIAHVLALLGQSG